MTNVVQVERVANGYLVRMAPARTGGGAIAAERVWIAAAPIDVATILEEEIWPPAAEPDITDAADVLEAPSMEDLEAAGVLKRGSDLTAAIPALDVAVERAPVADDGGEYPRVTHQGGRWTMECPTHGAYRAEFLGQVLRCVAKAQGKRCPVSMPLEAAHRAVGLRE